MAFQAYISAYPWDVVDEGVETVLDRLHGEMGVTGLSLWVGVPRVTQLRVREVQPRMFRTLGGLFFQPGQELYETTRCKPVVSTWLKGRNPLSRIAQGCSDREFKLRAMVSAASTGLLARRHPQTACKNVLGAESLSCVCLSNPDVQSYVCSLVSELSQGYTLSGLVLVGFRVGCSDPWSEGVQPSGAVGHTEASLLSLCFCESCQQGASAADIDIASAKRCALTVLQKSLDDGLATKMEFNTVLAEAPPLTAYTRWQGDGLSSLLRRIKDSCSCELLVGRIRHTAGPSYQPDSLDWSIPDAVVTRATGPEELPSAPCPGGRMNELILPESLVARGDGKELVSTVARAVELGFGGVTIDNYGLLSPGALTTIKRAVRFARRTTGG